MIRLDINSNEKHKTKTKNKTLVDWMHVFRKITHFFKSLKCMREIAYNEQNEFGFFSVIQS